MSHPVRLLCLLLSTQWLSGAAAPAAAVQPPARADGVEQFPTFGVAIAPPPGWGRSPVGPHLTVGDWTKIAPASAECTASVSVYTMPLAGTPEGLYQFGLRRTPTWVQIPDAPRRWVSSSFEFVPKGRPADSPSAVARHAVVELNAGETALLMLSYRPVDAGDREAYEAAVTEMVRSTRTPSKRSPPPRRAADDR